ncbi:Fc.00g051570.m01.CDS01 [Cosmosporella sp. VM-42]
MSMFGSLRRWLSLKQYQLEVTFSVYMFTPWEKFFFSSLVFLLFSLTFIAACLYLPHHISFLISRAWYYINGEHIDVAEAAREVVKEISASALHETGTVVREL